MVVRKVKAHASEEDVADGIISERDRFGNHHADAEAKRGARLAESLSPAGAARAELAKAVRWMGWVRRYAATWRPDAEEEAAGERPEGGSRREGDGKPGRAAEGLRHLIWERGLAWKCRRCGREAETAQKRRNMTASRCLGSAVGRLLARTCQDPEAISRSCVERRADLEGRGWRPRGGVEGGETVTAEARRPFEEEEGSEEEGVVGEVVWEEGEDGGEEGAGEGPWEDGREGTEEGGAVADQAAAATACGSGGATATQPQPGIAAGVATLRGSPLVPFPLPELPEEVAAEVIEEMKRRRMRGPAADAGEHGGRKRARAEPLRAAGPVVPALDAGGDPGMIEDVAAVLATAPAGGAADSPPADSGRRAPRERSAIALHEQRKRGSLAGACEGGAHKRPRMESPRAADAVASVPHDGGRHRSSGQQRLDRGRRHDEEALHQSGGSIVAAQPNTGLDTEQGDEAEGTLARLDEVADRRRKDEHVGGPRKRRREAGSGAPSEEVAGRPSDHPDLPQAIEGQEVRRYGRRYTGVSNDPVDAADARGHRLRITGSVIWCSVCGSHAARRLGKALKAECPGGATAANLTRLTRLRQGLHPLSAKPLV